MEEDKEVKTVLLQTKVDLVVQVVEEVLLLLVVTLNLVVLQIQCQHHLHGLDLLLKVLLVVRANMLMVVGLLVVAAVVLERQEVMQLIPAPIVVMVVMD